MDEIFDLIIIGSGPGGYHAALRAASYDAKVALIEKADRLGGTCSNWGCIPTKALYSSAKLIADIREKSEKFGVRLKDGFTLDFAQANERKNQVVKQLTDGIRQLCKAKKVEVFHGFGKLVYGNKKNGFRVSISKDDNDTYITGKRIILATGSAPVSIPSFNIDHKFIIDSDDILHPNFNEVPESLLIIGGGVIGCEFANIFAEFGSKVTILEYLPTILATEEKMIVKMVKKRLQHHGIGIHERKNVLSITSTPEGIKAVTCDAKVPFNEVQGAEKQEFVAKKCLVSIGRKKVSEGLNLESFGIETERGAIVIDQKTMETACPGIYAIGDCTGVLMLAHYASYQGDVAVAHILDSLEGMDKMHSPYKEHKIVPATIFTHPNIGSVGLTQKEAKQKYGKVLVGRFSYQSSGKALCMGEADEGMMIVIVDQATDKIVGATCYGEGAPELISEIAVAMENGLTTHDIGNTIHSHPTISEIALEAVEDTHGLAIHKAGKRK